MQGAPDWATDFGLRWYIDVFALVLAGGARGVFQRILEHPAARFIGVSSYSIYLVHEPVIAYLESRHVPLIVSGIAGVLVGIAFWALIERAFTRGAFRDALVDRAEKALTALLPRVGVPKVVPIGTASPIAEITPIPERREGVTVVKGVA